MFLTDKKFKLETRTRKMHRLVTSCHTISIFQHTPRFRNEKCAHESNLWLFDTRNIFTVEMENKFISKGSSKCVVTLHQSWTMRRWVCTPCGNFTNFCRKWLSVISYSLKSGGLFFSWKCTNITSISAPILKNHYIDYFERYVCWDIYLNIL